VPGRAIEYPSSHLLSDRFGYLTSAGLNLSLTLDLQQTTRFNTSITGLCCQYDIRMCSKVKTGPPGLGKAFESSPIADSMPGDRSPPRATFLYIYRVSLIVEKYSGAYKARSSFFSRWSSSLTCRIMQGPDASVFGGPQQQHATNKQPRPITRPPTLPSHDNTFFSFSTVRLFALPAHGARLGTFILLPLVLDPGSAQLLCPSWTTP
jgi:hypothetical protein